jgi:hypothetical protein
MGKETSKKPRFLSNFLSMCVVPLNVMKENFGMGKRQEDNDAQYLADNAERPHF